MTRLPTVSELHLIDGVVREPVSAADRLILWIPLEHEKTHRLWLRVATVVGGVITDVDGLSFIPVTSYQSKQRVLGAFDRVVGKLLRKAEAPGWSPPGAGEAEKIGGRRTDSVLAWSTHEENAESRVHSRWAESESIRKMGASLFLVEGVAAESEIVPTSEEMNWPESSRQYVETMLVNARKTGDRKGEAAALAEQGILLVRIADLPNAVQALENALQLYRTFGTPAEIAEVSSHLGSALTMISHSPRGLGMLEDALAEQVRSSDKYAEKLTLERLGMAYGRINETSKSLACFERAITLASALSDRPHEVMLLWHAAIRLAEFSRRHDAIASAQRAVDGFAALGDPKAAWYAEHLKRYIAGDAATTLGGVADASPSAQVSGPGWLKMAMSAGKAMTAFLGSGLKRVTPEVQRERLQTCVGCEHYTGIRCRLCGCFLAAKTWLPHEACPIGKWKAQATKKA